MVFQNNRDFFKRRVVFFKSGSSSGDDYDKAYNDRMATLAEKQWDEAEDLSGFYKEFYQPMEKAQIAANMEMIPHETGLQTEKIQAERTMLPGQTELTKAQNEASLSLLPIQTEYNQAAMGDAMAGMREKAPVRAKFFNESLTGVNVEDRANKAAADAAQSFAGSTEAMNRSLARSGVDPNSGRSRSLLNKNSMDRAKTIGSAKTTARTNAEEENYGRLTNAMRY